MQHWRPVLALTLCFLQQNCFLRQKVQAQGVQSQTAAAPALQGTDELALTTVRIEIFTGRTRGATATGFFFVSKDQRLFLVTNRHVVRNEAEIFYPDRLHLKLHTNANNLSESRDYVVELYTDSAAEHPAWREINAATDVVTLPLSLKDMQRQFVFRAFGSTDLITDDVVLGIGDPVVVIGYPLGFYDEVFNLPVVRQGSVGSVYPIPFRGNRYFLVDANLHPGTSGSPVVTRPTTMRMTKTGNMCIRFRLILLP